MHLDITGLHALEDHSHKHPQNGSCFVCWQYVLPQRGSCLFHSLRSSVVVLRGLLVGGNGVGTMVRWRGRSALDRPVDLAASVPRRVGEPPDTISFGFFQLFGPLCLDAFALSPQVVSSLSVLHGPVFLFFLPFRLILLIVVMVLVIKYRQ